MKFYYQLLIGIMILLNLFACSAEPEPINYGQDSCSFCGMTIMDNKYAAEAVTTKGKAYKFDAIECMIRYIDRNKDQEYAHLLISDYSNPQDFIDANNSTFLISENIPSPMGEFLSGFSSNEEAQLMLTKKGGTLYSWEHIQVQITSN